MTNGVPIPNQFLCYLPFPLNKPLKLPTFVSNLCHAAISLLLCVSPKKTLEKSHT